MPLLELLTQTPAITYPLVGILGGLARALYGLLKATSKGREINLKYFLITLVVSGIIGGILGYIFNMDYKIAALAGYVGTDILENVFKDSMKGNIKLTK